MCLASIRVRNNEQKVNALSNRRFDEWAITIGFFLPILISRKCDVSDYKRIVVCLRRKSKPRKIPVLNVVVVSMHHLRRLNGILRIMKQDGLPKITTTWKINHKWIRNFLTCTGMFPKVTEYICLYTLSHYLCCCYCSMRGLTKCCNIGRLPYP